MTALAAAGLVALAAAASGLAATPAAGSAAGRPDRLALLELLRAGDFERLEQEISGLGAGERGSDEALAAGFASFASADPRLEAPLARWLAARPRSYIPRLARASYERHLGALTPQGGHWSRAREDLKAAIALSPRVGLAYAWLADLALAEGDPGAADDWLERGRAAAPGSLVLRRAQLQALHPWRRAETEPAEVLAALERILEEIGAEAAARPSLAPLTGYADFVTAELLRRQRRYEQAAAYYGRALEAGADPVYLRQRGVNAFFQGRPRAARDSFEAALALSPQDPELLDWRARAAAALDESSAALADWRAALTLDPFNPRILINQARFLRALGDFAAAETALARALRYGADDAWVRRARGRFFLATRGQPKAALADLSRATELAPHDGDGWFMYARALFEARQCEKAAEVLATYAGLCGNGVRCAPGQLAWAERARQGTRDPGVCPVYGIIGP